MRAIFEANRGRANQLVADFRISENEIIGMFRGAFEPVQFNVLVCTNGHPDVWDINNWKGDALMVDSDCVYNSATIREPSNTTGFRFQTDHDHFQFFDGRRFTVSSSES
jgi:hypothetical protein